MRFRRKHLYRGTAVAGAIGLTFALLAGSSLASDAESRANADALRSTAQSPGAIVVVRDGDSVESASSGSTRLGAQQLPTAEDKFRVASHTKTVVATVLLQLVDEGKVELDAPIGDYLPGLVTGEGIDETKITVRHLLQHTSGLADFDSNDVMFDPLLQLFPPTPEQMVSLGLRHGSQSKPGTKHEYANTGYVIVGLLIEKLTGQRLGDVIDERIVEPLGLRETSYPYAGEKQIDGPHFRGYVGVPALMVDVTGYEPGILAGAGALVSSGSDMAVFFDALVGGELLSKPMLDQMRATFEDSGYGLGLAKAELSCGTAWWHNGIAPGYTALTISDGKGHSVFAGVNFRPLDVTGTFQEMLRISDAELCGSDGSAKVRIPDGLGAEMARAEEQRWSADRVPAIENR